MPGFTLTAQRLTPNAAKKCVVVFAEKGGKLTEAAQVVDEALGGFVKSTLKSSRYQGGMGEITRLTVGGGAIRSVVVVGVGKLSTATATWWHIGLGLGKTLDGLGVKEATIALGELEANTAACALKMVEGLHMAMYRFDQFKTELKEHQQPRFETVSVLTSTRSAREIEEQWPATQKLLAGNDTTRTAVNLPPNLANPQFMAEEAKKLEKLGVKVEIFDEKQLKKMGCNLILAVGGSAAEADQPRLITLHYQGAGKDAPTYAIVGKGIMFDTGGYNVKPGNSMRGMKFDMAGAAAVLGTMQALAARKAKVNVVGTMACAMNMIGTNPFVMDSIYKAYNGTTVEIGHTDAEGRLVLADAVAYTIEKFKPDALVDLATLTGACMVALGAKYAGLFTTKDALGNALKKAGADVGELLWELPSDDDYQSKSEVADICNDSAGGWGGASVGATFIKKFVGKTPWAHLDIAGTANAEKITGGNKYLKGGTGFGQRLLVTWLESLQVETAATPARKRRGRPAKAATGEAATSTGKRGRGRPRKAA
ncbi:MAG: leucyl aminopeptidase [Alphaproteobacteria bacterium]|nr:leucyl aminopeptidase [Alphaproteobacteria bacterium]